MKYIALLMLFSVRAFCQSTGAANTKGNCSPAITGHGNTINIKTCGIEQGDEFRKLLKSIASSQQLDTATILKRLDECLRTMADRHLTDAQKATVWAAISTLPGHKVSIWIPLGNSEAKGFAMDFVDLFRKAKWTGLEGAGLGQGIYDKDPVGIEVTVNDNDARTGKVPPDAVMLVHTFVELGLAANTIFANREVPTGETQIKIGLKPASH